MPGWFTPASPQHASHYMKPYGPRYFAEIAICVWNCVADKRQVFTDTPISVIKDLKLNLRFREPHVIDTPGGTLFYLSAISKLGSAVTFAHV